MKNLQWILFLALSVVDSHGWFKLEKPEENRLAAGISRTEKLMEIRLCLKHFSSDLSCLEIDIVDNIKESTCKYKYKFLSHPQMGQLEQGYVSNDCKFFVVQFNHGIVCVYELVNRINDACTIEMRFNSLCHPFSIINIQILDDICVVHDQTEKTLFSYNEITGDHQVIHRACCTVM